MSAIIHALTGRSDHPEKKSNSSSSVHKVVYEDIEVKSVVSTQTQSKPITNASNHKINALMAKLGSTHLQIDEYSRQRTQEISEAVKSSIDKVIHLIQTQQQQLLDEAQKESNKLEDEYKRKLMLFINELDQEKATKLVDLEKDLNLRQEQILESARKRIDAINEEANRLKMNVLKEAQAKTNSKMGEIAEKVVQLEAEDANRRLASTTKTIITTRSQPDNHPTKHN
ncbi:unnamed protein product [Rotaria socialis]|uniref:Uncharacterized protein n=1 Tax=Rotaria socialis TaxID=392032 RepID=A0A820TDG5_9BILA|nr:unnamed protein product [Rotaria socialis]CAF3311372.1 unnamed protein product [Rotaria socialis]CAF3318717.1 unnamed protein product [Rotaria socialis]CAF3531517.1 unnamed protein product [Rotaria socialis]CAF3764283.1 unnamed protein product [Rotaria socialis]